MREIDADLARTVPMQRLLQGDVGSGKTVVALYALLRAVEHGRQGALMAPTETLAEQHFLTIEGICAELGVTCALLTSASPKKARASRARRRRRRRHARADPGGRRAARPRGRGRRRAAPLRRRAAQGARARPRAARAAHDGDADPAHARAHGLRRPRRVGDREAARVAQADRHELDHGGAGVGGVHAADAAARARAGRRTSSARSSRRRRRRSRAPRRRRPSGCAAPSCASSASAACTAALKPAERRDVMARFKARELDVLVATTVIEVGVDVPNATVMIVQEADRFGLAQLHQLRGRVGRGAEQSYCLLVSRAKEELTETAQTRLEALVATTDGFELAEVDLDLRGGGAAARHAPARRHRPPLRAHPPRPAAARAGARRSRELARRAGAAAGRGRRALRARRTPTRSPDVSPVWTGALSLSPPPRRPSRCVRCRVALVTADTESHVVVVDLLTGIVAQADPDAAGAAQHRAGRRDVAVVAHTAVGAVSIVARARGAPRARRLRRAALHGGGARRPARVRHRLRQRGARDRRRRARRRSSARLKLRLWPRHLSLSRDGRTLWVGLGTASPELAVVDVSRSAPAAVARHACGRRSRRTTSASRRAAASG